MEIADFGEGEPNTYNNRVLTKPRGQCQQRNSLWRILNLTNVKN